MNASGRLNTCKSRGNRSSDADDRQTGAEHVHNIPFTGG